MVSSSLIYSHKPVTSLRVIMQGQSPDFAIAFIYLSSLFTTIRWTSQNLPRWFSFDSGQYASNPLSIQLHRATSHLNIVASIRKPVTTRYVHGHGEPCRVKALRYDKRIQCSVVFRSAHFQIGFRRYLSLLLTLQALFREDRE